MCASNACRATWTDKLLETLVSRAFSARVIVVFGECLLKTRLDWMALVER